jgi:hypothetical protein
MKIELKNVPVSFAYSAENRQKKSNESYIQVQFTDDTDCTIFSSKDPNLSRTGNFKDEILKILERCRVGFEKTEGDCSGVKPYKPIKDKDTKKVILGKYSLTFNLIKRVSNVEGLKTADATDAQKKDYVLATPEVYYVDKDGNKVKTYTYQNVEHNIFPYGSDLVDIIFEAAPKFTGGAARLNLTLLDVNIVKRNKEQTSKENVDLPDLESEEDFVNGKTAETKTKTETGSKTEQKTTEKEKVENTSKKAKSESEVDDDDLLAFPDTDE